MQQRQSEWLDQWSMFEDREQFLFEEWIQPHDLELFRDKRVLEGGCGGGQHTRMAARLAREVVAVDLNTVDVAAARNRDLANVRFVADDLAEMALGEQFDVAFSIGVVHHTDDPEKTVVNLKRHVKPGGTLVLWVYSREGNALMEHLVEPLRRRFLRRLDRRWLHGLSRLVTALMYPPIHTLYRLPASSLPYYEYFGNFRKLSFERNALNVFDKLNAPQTDFISLERAWAMVADMDRPQVIPYMGVSYCISGVKRASPET